MSREWLEPLNRIHSVHISDMNVNEQAIGLVSAYLWSNYRVTYSEYSSMIGRAWLNERGTMPKRITQVLYKHEDIKNPLLAKQLGDLIRPHVPGLNTYYFEFTADLDWKEGSFGDKNSCFWGDRSRARDILRSHDSRAVLFYRTKDRETGYARAWIVFPDAKRDIFTDDRYMPANEIGPSMVLFNPYGMLGETMSTILSGYLKIPFRLVKFSINEETDGDVWINHNDTENGGDTQEGDYGKGFFFTKHKNPPDGVDLNWPPPAILCTKCGIDIEPGFTYHSQVGHVYCAACYDHEFFICYYCGSEIPKTNGMNVLGTRTLCNLCARNNIKPCTICAKDALISRRKGCETLCEACFESASVCMRDKIVVLTNSGRVVKCPKCGVHTEKYMFMVDPEDKHKYIDLRK